MPHQILTIGSTFIDINITASVLAGKLELTNSYNVGGKGFNMAKGLRLFGLESHLATAISEDSFGQLVLDEINKTGIKLTKESLGYTHTPLACIVTEAATSMSNFEKVDTSLLDLQRFTELPTGVTQIIVSSNCNQQLLEFLKQQKDSNPRLELILSMSGAKTIANILSYLDIFDVLFANRKEAMQLQKSLNHEGDLIAFCHFLSRYPSNFQKVIITLDKDGLIGFNKLKEPLQGMDKNGNIGLYNTEIFTKPIYTGYIQPIVNTVGAGDALVSSLIAGFASPELTFEQTLELGLKVAAWHIRSSNSSLEELPEGIWIELGL